MTWFWLAISSYALLAVVAVGDRYLLSGPIPNHKLYTFYIGALGMLIFLLIPFVGWPIVALGPFLIALLAGIAFGGGLYFLFFGLERYEASRIVPAIGGLVPIATLVFSFILFKEARSFSLWEAAAFIALVGGSVLITRDKTKEHSRKSFLVALASGIFFGVSFALTKAAFVVSSFWPAFMWQRAGVFVVAAALFVFSRSLRSSLFRPARGGIHRSLGTTLLFLGNQSAGAVSGILQTVAIYLAPPLYVAFVNALQGTQYVFLLIFTAVLSFWFPQVLEESFGRQEAFRKISAIILIIVGIAILSLGK